MYEVNISIAVDADDAIDRLKDMRDRGQDLGRPLHWGGRVLQRAYSANFTTLGAEGARSMLKNAWPPLDTTYAAWKATRFVGAPPMVQTGKLFTAVKNLTRNPSTNVDRHEAEFAVDVPYAHWHQYGTRDMPARKIVFVPRDFPRHLGDKMAQYISEGKIIGD